MGKCKQKTHKASSKVLNKKKNGTITFKKSNSNHKTGKHGESAAVLETKNKKKSHLFSCALCMKAGGFCNGRAAFLSYTEFTNNLP